MNTFQKYAVLPREVQQEALDTFNRLQDMGECRPHDGWFQWWED